MNWWRLVYIGMLVCGLGLLFTEHWSFGVGLLSGAAIRQLMDPIYAARDRRRIARECAKLAFGYQAYLAAMIVKKSLTGEEVSKDEIRKQRFWARAAVRYANVGQRNKRINLRKA